MEGHSLTILWNSPRCPGMRFWYEVLHIELLVFTALTSYPPNCLGSLAGVTYVEHFNGTPNFRNLSMLTIHLQSFLHHIHPCINLYLMAGEVSVLPGTFCWQPLILSTCWWWSTFDLVISHSRPAIYFFGLQLLATIIVAIINHHQL